MMPAPMTQERPHILVVDDDSRLRELLRRYLSDNGFRVTTAEDAAAARATLASLAFDTIILDVMMPGESGLELVTSLRKETDTPVLMLTALGEPSDRVTGLELGADDYLTKPFAPRELLLRLNNVLRRAPAPAADVAPVRMGDVVFDPGRAELRRGGERIHLTTAEAKLLTVLAANIGNTLTRDDLTERSDINGGSRTVDVQVTRLRRKIEPDPRQPRYLQTVRGEGYVLRSDSG